MSSPHLNFWFRYFLANLSKVHLYEAAQSTKMTKNDQIVKKMTKMTEMTEMTDMTEMTEKIEKIEMTEKLLSANNLSINLNP